MEKFKNQIGQIEKGIQDVEPILDDEEFKDYCDYAYSCIAYLRICIKRTKEKENNNDNRN